MLLILFRWIKWARDRYLDEAEEGREKEPLAAVQNLYSTVVNQSATELLVVTFFSGQKKKKQKGWTWACVYVCVYRYCSNALL